MSRACLHTQHSPRQTRRVPQAQQRRTGSDLEPGGDRAGAGVERRGQDKRTVSPRPEPGKEPALRIRGKSLVSTRERDGVGLGGDESWCL